MKNKQNAPAETPENVVALTIPANDLTTGIHIKPEILAQYTTLARQAEVIPAVDRFTYEESNTVFAAVQAGLKKIEADRKLIKGPVLKLGDLIDTLAKQLSSPLEIQKQRLGRLILDCKNQMDREAAEAERLRQAEQRRLEDQALAEQDAAAKAGLVQQVEEVKEQKQVTQTLAAPKQATAVKVVTTYRLVIDNFNLIPHTLNGEFLLQPIDANIKRLLKAGVAVPGCRLVEEQGVGGK